MSGYTVRAVRWDGGWELHIDGVGVTQCATLAGAPRMVRSYLALDGHDASAAEIHVTPELDAELDEEVRRARAAVRDAEAGQRAAAALSRQAARDLVEKAGLTGADAAAVIGVSAQRVSQLLHA